MKYNTSKKPGITPGINPKVYLSFFPDIEKRIVHNMSKHWYITYSGRIKIGHIRYLYLLIKPVDYFQELFNIDREIVLIFSPYENFEPRTLDAYSEVYNKHQKLRLERICSILVSRDNDIENVLVDLLKNDQEAQIVVPFTYDELSKSIDNYFFRNRFKKHFYSRDLFALEAPLKKDLYFFGRTDLVHSLVDRHRSNQVSGLFGLRKTGKTSVIFGVMRALKHINANSAFIDCQNPALHRRTWNKALYYVLNEIKQQNNIDIRIGTEESYTEDKAPLMFEKYIIKMSRKLGDKSILIIFDEIENITPTVSPTKHWCEGKDFVFFWQTLRSLFQKHQQVFSYLIVGTNPLCVEMSKISNIDNPIYAQIPTEYIPRFDVPQTRTMVRRLGRIIGLKFDEILYGKLTEDFGGHPFLIRHVCSVINTLTEKERPVKVGKLVYEKAKKIFIRDYGNYMDMILSVLREHFNDEYEMLRYLARGDEETFAELAKYSRQYTNHLIGYGIIEEDNGKYVFKIDTVEEYIRNIDKYKKIELTQEEMLSEISERRNKIEKKLRKLCRMQLKAFKGEKEAYQSVMKIIGEKKKRKMRILSYKEIFDDKHTQLYFIELGKIIIKNWECFKNILGPGESEIKSDIEIINKYRSDAHAKEITKNEFKKFRIAIEELEKKIEEYLGK